MRKQFPIMFSERSRINESASIPWEVIAPHEQQALKNHGQTLERLAQRGGLSYGEAYAVLNDREWKRLDEKECELAVLRIVRDFYIEN